MWRPVASIAAGLLVCATASLSQTIYQSRGKNGVPVYSDRPPADGKIEKTFVYEYLPSSPISAPTDGDARTPPRYRLPRTGSATGSVSTPPNSASVTLFGTRWCPYCRGARTYLAQHGVAYQEIDIDTPSGRYAYDAAGGRSGVPLLIVGDRRVQGFSQKGYDGIFAKQ